MVETVVRNAIHARDALLVVATKTIARSELSENIQIVWMLIDILLVIGDGMERVMLVHATVALQYQVLDGSLLFWADIPMIPRNTKQMMNKYLFMLILFVCCYDIEYDQLIELELLQFDRVALVASV